MGDKTRAMGTKQEICQLDNAYKKRAELRREISRRIQMLRRQGKCIRPQQTLQAWKQEAQYAKKHAAEIQYARRPIIDIIKGSDKREQKGPGTKTGLGDESMNIQIG